MSQSCRFVKAAGIISRKAAAVRSQELIPISQKVERALKICNLPHKAFAMILFDEQHKITVLTSPSIDIFKSSIFSNEATRSFENAVYSAEIEYRLSSSEPSPQHESMADEFDCVNDYARYR